MNRKMLTFICVVGVLLLGGTLAFVIVSARRKPIPQNVSKQTIVQTVQKADPKDLMILKKQSEQINKIGESIEYFEKRSKYDFEKELDLRIETSSF